MNTTKKHTLNGSLYGALSLVLACPAIAHEDHTNNGDVLKGGLSSGSDFFRIDPSLHVRAVHGETTFTDGEIEAGGHDPNQDGFNLQGIEVGASFYAGDYIAGFVNANIFKPDGEEFEAEFEEGFIKLQNLPGGLEFRAGRMLVRFGDQNAKHLHGFDFVNTNIGNVRFLGDEGLAIEGGEISWLLPTPIEDILSISFGDGVPHEEEEGEEEEELGEQILPLEDILSLRYQARFGSSDFHRFQVGASYITGDNELGGTTNLYGADVTYTWRENGLESGGKQFRWRTEWIMRDAETPDGDVDENTFNTSLLWEFVETWEAGIRYDWVEGIDEAGLPERDRISASIAKRFPVDADFTGIIRLQYDHDNIDGEGTEDSVWLQFGFDWGPGEVR